MTETSNSSDHSMESSAEWVGKMIKPLSDQGVGQRCPFVQSVFSVDSPDVNTTLRISALGLYICFINGERVGKDILTPGWTCYDKRLSYQTYNVGSLLKTGQNSIEIWLADGWMRSQMMWREFSLYNVWGDDIAAIAELRTPDGQVIAATDDHWSSGLLPVMRSGIYFGEIFDARKKPTLTEQGTSIVDFSLDRLIKHEIEPVKELAALDVVKSWDDDQGRVIFDFGQNSAGYVSVTVQGEPGASIFVEHAEVLDQNGVFNNANLRTAECQLEYFLAGGEQETYKPLFTFQGFRYARIECRGNVSLMSVQSIPISSVVAPTGNFTCGNSLVNKLVQNTLWSQRANFIEVPTDCPQRDERFGWTGDAQVFSGTACYLHDCHGFFVKFLRDVMVDQRASGAIAHVTPDPTRMDSTHYPNFVGSTGWGDAICIIPWDMWLHYGDNDILLETLPAMVKWVDYVWGISNGPIVQPPRDMHTSGFTFGDWLQPGGPSNKPWPTIGDEAAATIYLYIASNLTAKIAKRLGNNDIANRMQDRAEVVKRAFTEEFITSTGRLVYDDQTSYSLAFIHDLIPADRIEAAKKHFINSINRTEGRIGTGFIGTPALLPALVKIGEPELAAQVFLQEEVPGWLYQVKMGATSIWERWDALFPDGSINGEQMNSYNHYAYGAVCQWLFESVAGFRPDPEQPAFQHIIFEPTIIPELSPVTAHHESVAGKIEVFWEVNQNHVTYTLTIPEGSTATVRLAAQYTDIELNGNGVPHGSPEKKANVQEVPLSSGKHNISFNLASVSG